MTVYHTYANLAAFRDFTTDQGSTILTNAYNAARMLAILRSVSRTMDRYANRGTSFGPEILTRRYRPDGSTCIDLKADLLTISSVTTKNLDGTGSATITDNTDFYKEPLNEDQKRELVALFGTFGPGWLDVAGTWGYQNVTAPSTTTVASGLSVGTTATTFTTSASPTISPGDTLLIESEALFVRALSGTTATVVRGVHGTTAATHADASAIATYQYPEQAIDTCLRLADKRWKARDAGADGTEGGFDYAATTPREGEAKILMNGIGSLVVWSAG